MADVASIIDYYAALLIVQYRNKPKAQATIQLFAETLLANGVMLDVRDGYDIDTAVGKQLDTLGKYAGVDRFYKELDLINFFAFTDYTESDPDADPKFGFSTYATFNNYAYNGTLTYDAIISTNNRLIDDAFRVIIKLAILRNTSNHSHKQIDDGLYEFFGTALRAESTGDMHMVYFVSSAVTTIINATLYKNLLPKPMGVGLGIVSDVRGDMFGFTDYSGYESPYANGFSDYSTYDTVAGQVLTYDQINQGSS